VLAKPVGMNCEDCACPCAWLFWLCCGGVFDWGGASGRGSMRCIACVVWSPRRAVLGGQMFLFGREGGRVSRCVNECQAVCGDGDVGQRARSRSAGAVVVTAAFASKRHGGAGEHLAGGGECIKCMHVHIQDILSSCTRNIEMLWWHYPIIGQHNDLHRSNPVISRQARLSTLAIQTYKLDPMLSAKQKLVISGVRSIVSN
jgi:hypothetical protein